VCKIRNFGYLENLQKLFLLETLGNTFELVTIFERKKNFIHNCLALPFGFLEPRQNYENHLQNIVADFRVLVVPHG
jgi:hypothetical protein